MAYQDRIQLIEEVQTARGNTIVLTYITSTRSGLESMISMDSISKTYKLLQKISTPKESTIIDLFIYSNGGDGIVPWKLVTLIRDFCKEFNVIVPYRAFSAATLTALGANNIYMHPMGMLGPTDPKVTNEFNPIDPNTQQKLGISVEDVFSYISLVKEDVGITHEDELVRAWGYLAGEGRIHPLALGNVKRFYSQSRMMAKKLLELHMPSSQTHQVTEIADSLNSKLYFHGHPINFKEAKALGLKVKEMSPELREAVWRLYSAYEEEMKFEEPFKPDMELKASNPNYPMVTPGQQPPSPATLNLEESVTCIESAAVSYTLKVGLTVEGYKSLASNGIQEYVNLQQTSEKWHETLPA